MKTFQEIHDTLYIRTNDGHIGVVMAETKCFIDTVVEFAYQDGKPFTLKMRFSKETKRQVGTPSRSFEPLAYADA